MPAKRVLVPTTILPPDYKYVGDVRVIIVPDRVEASGEPAVEGTAPATASTGLLTEAEVIQRLVTEVLPGKNNNLAVSVLAALAPEMRVPAILSGLATGELTKRLAAEGKIVIAADGIISLP